MEQTQMTLNEGPRLAYLKPVAVADLPRQLRKQAGDLDTLYAVHDDAGQQLALVADPSIATALAREHDYTIQPLH